MRHLSAILLAFLLAPGVAGSADVAVVGLFPNKAVVVIDGGKPRTLSVGETTPEGVRLISADSESATFEIDGKRETLAPGQRGPVASGAPRDSGRKKIVITADSRGHFFTTGSINGVSTRFMVDTGATTIALSSAEAKRTGVNYLAGRKVLTQTANGVVPVYRVRLEAVDIRGIKMSNVEAIVIEGGRLPVALLGMSFLNRMEMRREGDTMMLIQRY
ncbi:MAG: TIGR02281 family clan AA aspartic protease [Betaproteobacteria bacterium]|nr:TIGR02281 family clan AA aspartic protease [Betaproteobacteria bacterium]MDH3436574.1 TIGR02281 family clan AA aspartic protease [Betaproteobacteria bacterium]